MYLIIEENPNCAPEERVFATLGAPKAVKRVNMAPPGKNESIWCDIAAVGENGSFEKPQAQRVDDSADGTAWLVFGGPWGLRLRAADKPANWSIEDKNQWGLPFLVLDSSGAAIDFE